MVRLVSRLYVVENPNGLTARGTATGTESARNMTLDLEGATHRVVVKDSSPMILARPKSASFTDNALSASSIFSGLMSR